MKICWLEDCHSAFVTYPRPNESRGLKRGVCWLAFAELAKKKGTQKTRLANNILCRKDRVMGRKVRAKEHDLMVFFLHVGHFDHESGLAVGILLQENVTKR